MNRLYIGLVVLLLSSGVTIARLPTLEEVDFIIEEIELCIEIHQWYIDHDYQRRYTGDTEWHQRWIDTYEKNIEILYAYRYMIRILRLEPPRLTIG